MPISFFVFAFLSLIGVASGTALLISHFGLLEIANRLIIWLFFLAFSMIGPLGIMMAAQRPGRLLILLGVAFTLLGVASVSALFASALGIMQVAPPIVELFVLSFLGLIAGLSMVSAGRASITKADTPK